MGLITCALPHPCLSLRALYLLFIPQFNPTQEMLESNRLSNFLHEYLETVLWEFKLKFSRFFSSTTDSSSDVKPVSRSFLPGLCEWCVYHMLNCTLVEVHLEEHELPTRVKGIDKTDDHSAASGGSRYCFCPTVVWFLLCTVATHGGCSFLLRGNFDCRRQACKTTHRGRPTMSKGR